MANGGEKRINWYWVFNEMQKKTLKAVVGPDPDYYVYVILSVLKMAPGFISVYRLTYYNNF